MQHLIDVRSETLPICYITR